MYRNITVFSSFCKINEVNDRDHDTNICTGHAILKYFWFKPILHDLYYQTFIHVLQINIC